MEKVSAIVIHEHGEPAKVARLEAVELEPPLRGEARVRVRLAAINPADINVLEGKYPIRPELPGVPGVEGVGGVESLGPDTDGIPIGATVLLPHRFGAWREAGNARVEELVRVPDGVPLEQAAMLRINPASALLMLREFVELRAGEWVVQNAANSAVGRSVIRIARQRGLRTVNVVRRAELVEELKKEGADVVLVESESLTKEIAEAVAGEPIRLAFNAVGGDSATRIAGALASGGVIVTYGAMARQPLKIPNGQLIFQDIAWRGFWVSRWYEHASAEARGALFRQLSQYAIEGVVATPVEAVYALGDIAAALEHAQRSKRGGKILIRCSA